ncbi:hypothetical protein N182_18420 [Sinorhizobium sp. GL2]|nr:hypothetical protein N182_18420 [Sinorhizobium sp. GL2]
MSTEPLPLTLVFKQAGSASELARRLKITPSAVLQWDKVPPTRVLEVERIPEFRGICCGPTSLVRAPWKG